MPIHILKRTEEPNLVIEEAGHTDHPAILFIHGLSHSRHIWQKQIKSFLANQFRLIFIDLRGHGDSEKPYNQYSESEKWANDIHHTLDMLNIKRVFICAWSYAALITCDYLKSYGEQRVAGINFIAPFFGGGSKQNEFFISQRARCIFNDFSSIDFNINILATRKWVKLLTYKEMNQADHNYIFDLNLPCPHYVREALLSRKVNNEESLKNITIPLLLTHGDKDKVVFPAASFNQQKLTPHAIISIFKNTGHIPFWEDADRFNNELTQFANHCFKT